jgi:hypothetical protein
MPENNIYNIDREFDYCTIKSIVSKSLQKIAKEEALKNDVIFDYGDIDDYSPNNVIHADPPTPLLKLKIRNTTKYLTWRIAVLKRDNFTCQMCHASLKKNKSLRLEVHHAKAFDDICMKTM